MIPKHSAKPLEDDGQPRFCPTIQPIFDALQRARLREAKKRAWDVRVRGGPAAALEALETLRSV